MVDRCISLCSQDRVLISPRQKCLSNAFPHTHTPDTRLTKSERELPSSKKRNIPPEIIGTNLTIVSQHFVGTENNEKTTSMNIWYT